ncbi:hypothetical protein ACGFYY_15435 [Streptomyces sp. NPDC048331]|uniref:hypothetical protein n=1 Tax=unclassified Streptomyces TaxID=2593676 RepID=UPI0034216A40
MSIVEERPLVADPVLRAPVVRVSRIRERPAQAPARPDAPPTPTTAEPALALAMASIRISRGNPTVEETAALAALLTARLRLLHHARESEAPTVLPRKLPRHPCPPFRAPGAWAS